MTRKAVPERGVKLTKDDVASLVSKVLDMFSKHPKGGDKPAELAVAVSHLACAHRDKRRDKVTLTATSILVTCDQEVAEFDVEWVIKTLAEAGSHVLLGRVKQRHKNWHEILHSPDKSKPKPDTKGKVGQKTKHRKSSRRSTAKHPARSPERRKRS